MDPMNFAYFRPILGLFGAKNPFFWAKSGENTLMHIRGV
jgi:hypothetical protein